MNIIVVSRVKSGMQSEIRDKKEIFMDVCKIETLASCQINK